jgi:hypothetical protein
VLLDLTAGLLRETTDAMLDTLRAAGTTLVRTPVVHG